MSATKIGILCSRVRVEEKLIFAALEERGVDFERIDARKTTFDLNHSNLDEYDAVLISFAVGTRDADRGMASIYESTQWVPKSFNLSFYANDDVDAALQAARQDTDQQERLRLYGEAGKQIMEDAPAIFLVSYEFVGAYSNKVHGVQFDPNGGVRVSGAWLEK